MRKILLILIATVFIVGFSSNKLVKEGWLNKNTFLLKAMGYAPLKQVNFSLKKRLKQACAAAEVVAQFKLIDTLAMFAIQEIKQKHRNAKFSQKSNYLFSREVAKYVRNGKVIQEIPNTQKMSCEIVYQVKGYNLKDKILKATFKTIVQRNVKN